MQAYSIHVSNHTFLIARKDLAGPVQDIFPDSEHSLSGAEEQRLM